jgi:hypothetical protein
MGNCFSLGSFLKTAKVAQFCGLLFSAVKVMYSFWQKMAWATFWAIFSPTHLVTLRFDNFAAAAGTVTNIVDEVRRGSRGP